VGLAGILDHVDAELIGDFQDGLHVGGLAIKMHRHDGPSSRRDGLPQPLGIERARLGLDVHEHRRGADIADRPDRCDKRHRDGDDLVAWDEAEYLQRQMQRAGAAVDADAMANLAKSGEIPLKGFNGRAQDKPSC
jgi:hypothetical protein